MHSVIAKVYLYLYEQAYLYMHDLTELMFLQLAVVPQYKISKHFTYIECCSRVSILNINLEPMV